MLDLSFSCMTDNSCLGLDAVFQRLRGSGAGSAMGRWGRVRAVSTERGWPSGKNGNRALAAFRDRQPSQWKCVFRDQQNRHVPRFGSRFPMEKPSLEPLSAQEPPALPTERSRSGKARAAAEEPRREVTGLRQHTAWEKCTSGHALSCETTSYWATHWNQYLIYFFCDTAATTKDEDHYQRSLLHPPHLLTSTGFPQTTTPRRSANTASVLAISHGEQPPSWSHLGSPTAAALGTPRGEGGCAPCAEGNGDLAFTCVFPGSQLSLLLKKFWCGKGGCFRFQEFNMQVIVWQRSWSGGSSVSWEPSSATAASQ